MTIKTLLFLALLAISINVYSTTAPDNENQKVLLFLCHPPTGQPINFDPTDELLFNVSFYRDLNPDVSAF